MLSRPWGSESRPAAVHYEVLIIYRKSLTGNSQRRFRQGPGLTTSDAIGETAAGIAQDLF